MSNAIKEDEDCYRLLGLEFGASQDEIVTAYRRLARQYHPDKNTSLQAELRDKNEEKFRKIKKAYEILSDPTKRAIYNEFGIDGLKYQGWDLVKKHVTTAELHEHFEKLQKQIIDQKLAVMAKPYASFTLGIDASSIFNKQYEDDDDEYDQNNGNDDGEDDDYEISIIDLIPSIEISHISATMKVDNELAKDHALTLTGNLTAKNGTGDGAFGFTYGYKYSQHTLFNLNNVFGSKPSLSLSFQHAFNKKTYVDGEALVIMHPQGLMPGARLTVGHKLSDNVTGKLTYREIADASVKTELIYANEKLGFEVVSSYKLSLINQRVSIAINYFFNEKNSRLSVSTALTTNKGLTVAYGCQTRVMDINVVGATLVFSAPSGVTLQIVFKRANQEFNFPIYLSDEVAAAPIFYGTVVPLLVYTALDRFYSKFGQRGGLKKYN